MNNDHEDEDEAPSGTKNDNAPNELTDNAHNEFNDEDEEGLVEVMEEQELYEALNTLTQSVDDPEKVIQLQEKLKRYQKIMEQKNIICESLLEELKIAKHNATLMAQVEINQAKELDEKDKAKEKLFKEVRLAKEKIKEKDAMIKHLEEALGAEENEEVEIVQASVNTNKNKANHECNACDKVFRTGQDLERHIDAKHEDKTCTYCDQTFSGDQALVKHHKQCVDQGVRTAKCNKCEKIFTNFALKKHKDQCQGKQLEIDCPECGEIYRTTAAMKKHYDSDHKNKEIRPMEVCKWWRQGKCTNKQCKYAHVGYQNKSVPHAMQEKNTRVPPCSNGPSCDWLEKGCCSYFHPRVGVQKPWTSKNRGRQDTRSHKDTRFGQDSTRFRQDTRPREDTRSSQGTRSSQDRPRQYTRNNQLSSGESRREICRYDGRCDRIPNCPHLHILSLEDFPLFQGRRIPVLARKQTQRRS